MWLQRFLSLFETGYLHTVDSGLVLAGVTQPELELLIPLLYPPALSSLTRCARDLLGKNICEGRGGLTRDGCRGVGSFRSQRKIKTCKGVWD